MSYKDIKVKLNSTGGVSLPADPERGCFTLHGTVTAGPKAVIGRYVTIEMGNRTAESVVNNLAAMRLKHPQCGLRRNEED